MWFQLSFCYCLLSLVQTKTPDTYVVTEPAPVQTFPESNSLGRMMDKWEILQREIEKLARVDTPCAKELKRTFPGTLKKMAHDYEDCEEVGEEIGAEGQLACEQHVEANSMKGLDEKLEKVKKCKGST